MPINVETMPGGGPAREPWIQLRLSPAEYAFVNRCPLCRTKANVQLSNTHTGSYSIGCEGCDLMLGDIAPGNRGHTMAAHKASAARVLERWNQMDTNRDG